MALALAVPASISQQPAKSTRVNSRPIPALLWAGLLTAVVAGPWLLPGFVFGTDWPGPRRIDFPISVFSAAPLEALIAAVSYAIGSEAAGKVLIVISLFTAAFLAYRSVQPGDCLLTPALGQLSRLQPVWSCSECSVSTYS